MKLNANGKQAAGSAQYMSPGKYICRIVKAEWGDPTQNGEPQARFILEAVGGTMPGAIANDRQVINDNSMPFILQKLLAIGVEPDSNGDFDFEPTIFQGRHIVALIGEREGRDRNGEVRTYADVVSWAAVPATAPAEYAPPRQPVSPGGPVELDADDIPF